jgi:hypothetical protein
MGAKMTPTMKKRGRTVLGVRMGLLRGQPWLLPSPAMILPTAMLSSAAA